MKKLFFVLLIVLLSPGIIFSKTKSKGVISFYNEVTLAKTNVTDTVKLIQDKLEKKGNGVLRILKFSEVVKGQGGENFPDYTIILSCDSKKNQNLVIKEPALINLLPCSIVVYDAGKGNVKINIANPDVFAKAAGVSPEARKAAHNEYEKITKSLGFKFKSGSGSTLGNIFTKSEAGNGDLQEFNTLLISSLQGENLNIVFGMNYGIGMTTHFVCSAGIGSIILKNMPEFGVFAPCRLVVLKKGDKIIIGMMNIKEVVKSNEGKIGSAGIQAAEDLDKSVRNALGMVSGQ